MANYKNKIYFNQRKVTTKTNCNKNEYNVKLENITAPINGELSTIKKI